MLFGLFQAITVATYTLPAMGFQDLWLLYVICSLEHFASGTATAALFTVMMDQCKVVSAATDYTIQASLVVISTGIAAAISGFLAAGLGYQVHFLLSTLLCMLGVLASIWYPHTLNKQQPSTI